MSSASLSECIGKFAGLFGLRLEEAAGSFQSGFLPGFFFPVFCFFDGLFPLAQGEVVQALHSYFLLQGSSGSLEVKVPRQSEESLAMPAVD